MRLFIGLAVPAPLRDLLLPLTEQYAPSLKKITPPESWHITLAFLGEQPTPLPMDELSQPLISAFVPTIAFTHVGRGRQRSQLWAYAQPTTALNHLQQNVRERLTQLKLPLPPDAQAREFLPHIRLATFLDLMQGRGIADTPVSFTFVPREAYVYRSEQTADGRVYHREATIPLT
jgi:RNA 2',3'-cyclic 3'-phosphodiesterase